MKITPGIKNAFSQKAAPGVHLVKIEVTDHATEFTASVQSMGRSFTIGCSGRLTPKQAEAEAGRVAAYLSQLAPRPTSPDRDRLEVASGNL